MAIPLNLLAFEVQSVHAADLAQPSTRTISLAKSSTDPIELTSQRDRFSKTYLLSDGKKRKVISSEPINYQTNENNHTVWREIDSTLVPQSTVSGAQQYKNKANDFDLTISDDLANQGVAVSKGDTGLNLKVSDLSGLRMTSRSALPLVGNTPVSTIVTKPVLTKDEAAYKNIGQDIDINYKSTATGIKDEIILNKNTGQNFFSFQLDLTGVYFKQLSTGAFVFYNSKTNEPTYYMPQSFMNDAVRSQEEPEGALSYDVKTEILPQGQGFEVRLTADKNWLDDPKRIYPVIIDPSIQVGLNYGEDSFVQSGYPTINSWDQSRLYLGRTTYYSKGVTRTYIPFSVPDLTHARIYSANFSAYQYYCDGVCQSSGVSARLTGGYDFKTITWNSQPWVSGSVGSLNDSGINKWINIDVTAAAKHWFEQGNSTGSLIGSLAFFQDDESNYGRRNWWAENSTSYSPTLSIDYNDYNDAIAVSSNFPTIYVDDTFSNLPANVANWGRNTWSQSNTRLSYHVYDAAGNCVNYEGLRTSLPRDVGGGGDQVSLDNVQLKVPSTPGDYLIKWDIVQEGVTWLSQQGLATYDYWIHVNDYPEYSASYQSIIAPASATSGSTINVPVTVQNNTRYNWATDKYKLSYHWIDNITGDIVIKDGLQTQFPAQVNYRGGKGTVNLQVKAPYNAGNYKLKIDLLQVGVAWFSDKGVATADYNINITTASLSNLSHLGTEDYYAKVGPVDLATGNLSYSSTDMAVNSNTGLLSVERSYNANSMDQTYNGDSSGYVQNWLLNGPYKENNQSLRLNEKYIASEETIRPNTGSSTNGKTWFKVPTDSEIPIGESCNIPTPPPSGRAVTSSHPVLDINKALDQVGAVQSGYGNNSVVYAHSYIYSPVNQTVLLSTNADDGHKVWLNGQMIHAADLYFDCYIGDGALSATLKTGWNSLLVKVSNSKNNWRFSAKITNSAGNAVSGLKFGVDNQDIFGDYATLGKGWTANLKERLVTTDLSNIYYRDGTGSVNLFVKKSDGSYQRPTGTTLDLVKNVAGTFTINTKSGLKINFNAGGILQNKTDLSNNVITYQYDSSGNCIKIVDTNRYIALTYTTGRLTSISNQLGNKYTYNYDTTLSPVRLTSVTDPSGNTFSYKYDTDGRMTTFTNKSGAVTTISYNTDNKVSAIKDALGYSTLFTYRAGAVDITDALGRKSTAELDKNNLLTAFTNAKTYREFYQYDGSYNILTVTPDLPINDQYYFNWSYSYDSNNNLLSATDPMQQKTVFVYSGNDLVKETDPDSSITQYSYSTDGRRLLLSNTDPKGNVNSSIYDSKGRKLTATDPMMSVTKFTYSADGDVLTTITPKGEVTTNTFDSIGRTLTTKSPLGKITSFTYNPLSLVTKVTDPAGLTALTDYDKNGNITKQTDPKGAFKTFGYDAIGQLIKITDEVGAVTQSVYDAVGNKIKDIDANGEITTYQYDQLNQPITQTDPSAGKSTITYDRNGAVTKVIDQKNQSQTQEYNKNGGTTKTVDPEGTTTLTYNKDGKVTNAASTLNSENIAVSYDTNNNVTKLQSNLNGTVTATYNKNDSPVTIQTPTAITGLAYDANGGVSQVSTTLNSQTLTTKFTKDAEGKTTLANKPNGDSTGYIYDGSNRLTQLTNRNVKNALMSQFNYVYDKTLNITSVKDGKTGVTNSYSYDARNQLIKEGNKTFAYDPMGNRKTVVDSTGTTTYLYDTAGDSNRLLKVTYPNGRTINYQYDANGNIIQQTDSLTGTTTYSYDSDNYFVKAVLPDKNTVQYTYDKILKLRTKRIQTNPAGQITTTTNFIYDGDRLVSETDQNNKITRSYSWDQNERLIGVSIPDSSGALKNFTYQKNAKEDIVGMTDASGNLVVEYLYDAWGNIITSVTKSNSPIANLDKLNIRLYSSYWYDSALGLYFMKARMYNSVLGRFLSKDPAMTGGSALSSNPYIYCYNNPVNGIDPSGKMVWSIALPAGWANDVLNGLGAFGTAVAAAGAAAVEVVGNLVLAAAIAAIPLFAFPGHAGSGSDTSIGSIAAGAAAAAAGGAMSPGNNKDNKNTSRNYKNKPTPEPPNDPVQYKDIAQTIATTVAGREILRLNDDQAALVAIADRAKNIGAISLENAKTLINWAQEYGVRYESHLAGHLDRAYDLPHIAIYTVNHITVLKNILNP